MRIDPALVLRPARTEATRRRIAMLRWSGGGVAIATLAVAFTWSLGDRVAIEPITMQTMWWCLGACVVTALFVDRQIHTPATEGYTWVLFSTATVFLALLLLFGVTHAFYSRLVVVVAFVVDSAWLAIGVHLLIRGRVLRFGVCESGVVDALERARAAVPDQAPSVRAELILTDDVATLSRLDGVIVDRYSHKSDALRDLLGTLRLGSVRIYSADHIHELLTGRVSLDHVEDSFLDDSSGKLFYSGLKRAMDLAGATLLILLLGIPMLVVALAIRAGSAGPVLFRQRRIGVHGRPFDMIKFRTMTHAPVAAAVRPVLDHSEARVTPIGRLLRRFRIDELPQLFNVLDGTMSLIGPRPEWTATADPLFDRIAHFPYRHLVRPGITGWAQVNQGHVTGMGATMIKLEFDLYYVKHCSLALDVVIGIRTIRTVLTGYGAR